MSSGLGAASAPCAAGTLLGREQQLGERAASPQLCARLGAQGTGPRLPWAHWPTGPRAQASFGEQLRAQAAEDLRARAAICNFYEAIYTAFGPPAQRQARPEEQQGLQERFEEALDGLTREVPT